jgi:phosphate transport system permease protein
MATTAVPPPPPADAAAPKSPSGWGDRVFHALSTSAAISILVCAAVLVFVLLVQAWPTLIKLGRYQLLTSDEWNPGAEPPIFGSLAFVYGTLTSSAIAMLIAVPVGVGSAAFLSEIAHGWLRKAGSFLVELLAAVPSVVYGFWGIHFLRPVIQFVFDRMGGPNTAGAGILAAGILLSIMIVPYITAITYDVCRSVPRTQREGALALGATRWQMIRSAVLPFARPGILAACFLALGRALGETMAVTMVIGNRTEIDFSIFAVGDSMASVIANRLNEADTPQVRSALVAMGFLLLVITSLLNILGRLLIRRSDPAKRSRPVPATPTIANGAAGPDTVPPEVKAARHEPLKAVAPKRDQIVDRVMTWALGACLFGSLIPLFLILGYITQRGAASINWAFFTQTPRPLSTGSVGGLKHAIVGSAILVALAVVMAVPVGILTAVFLAESRARRLAGLVRFVTEILGGVPSIVLGIFSYSVFVVPLVGGVKPLGFSAWAGAFALAVMMIPVVVRSAEEAIRMVPQSLRHASYALGASFSQTVRRVTVPAALPAILTGVILAASRIAGETAPLLLTAYGSNSMPTSLGEQTPFLPGYIYNYSTKPELEYQQQAWAAALVLLGCVMMLNVGIRLLSGKRLISASHAD